MKASTAFVLVIAMAAGAASCGWWRWQDLATTHAGLLDRLAHDAVDAFTAPDGGLEPGDIERLRYPLMRARQFEQSNRRRFEGAAWLERFEELLRSYAELIGWLDRARTLPVGEAERQRAAALAAAVADASSTLREALERRSAGNGALAFRLLPVG